MRVRGILRNYQQW
nr:truncated envelope glycoprotein [Human immunodeficiency virus 1]